MPTVYPIFPQSAVQWNSPNTFMAKVDVQQYTKGGMSHRVRRENPITDKWEVTMIVEDKLAYDEIEAFLKDRQVPKLQPFRFFYKGLASERLYTCTTYKWTINADLLWQLSATFEQTFRY